MQKHHVVENRSQTKKLKYNELYSFRKLNSKSTFKSVNFGVWIQNVYQCYLCRWLLLRDVQNFQNLRVSFICMFGILSSVVIALSSAGYFSLIAHFRITKSQRTQISGWVCLHFCFYVSRDRSSYRLGFFKHLQKTRKPIKQICAYYVGCSGQDLFTSNHSSRQSLWYMYRHIAHSPASLLSTRLDYQFIIKEYSSGTAWWKKCLGQDTWEGAQSFQVLWVCRSPQFPCSLTQNLPICFSWIGFLSSFVLLLKSDFYQEASCLFLLVYLCLNSFLFGIICNFVVFLPTSTFLKSFSIKNLWCKN